ncbi:thioesterase family protein [Xanthobacter dioxanivorans]|uniref:Thioesterase family protein n=1 Tax=Xanthobacter dioxanivorans TaxID=2528964 RepID=A0A974PMX1_9HYPH|nr:thioesterase family protein [Xanthobacter dioxanivorans]QRG06509.1 thioesterase family protein [Xanthobacter dioxanivorans]
MLDRIDFEPLFFAPFVSSSMRVEEEWTDYNGHLNMAYYSLIFDRAMDEALSLLGLGPDYAGRRGASFFTAESHVRYLRELPADSPVRVALRLVDYDEKRLHLFQSLHHATEGWVSATSEQMALHVNLKTRHVMPFPDDVLERIATMRASHAALPTPEGIGRHVGMSPRL